MKSSNAKFQKGERPVHEYEIVWQGVAPFEPYSMHCANHPAYFFVFVVSKVGLDVHQNFDRKFPAMVYSGGTIISTLIRKEDLHP
jgi:hypothetical protein